MESWAEVGWREISLLQRRDLGIAVQGEAGAQHEEGSHPLSTDLADAPSPDPMSVIGNDTPRQWDGVASQIPIYVSAGGASQGFSPLLWLQIPASV